MHTHPGVCVSFFPPAPALEPARPTDDVRPMFGLVCGNSRRRLAISAATSRFIPCLRWAAHALLRILRPHASLFIIHHRGPQCNEKAASGVIFMLKLVFCAAEARRKGKKRSRGGGLAQGENARVHGEVFCAEGGKKRSYSGKRRALSGPCPWEMPWSRGSGMQKYPRGKRTQKAPPQWKARAEAHPIPRSRTYIFDAF